jgi:hypothetical protein
MSKSVIVQEWYSDLFHQKVFDFDKDGYVAGGTPTRSLRK